MRGSPLLLLIAVAGCAAPTNAPSLAPRAAEAIDPRVPVPEPVASATPTPALAEKLNGLVSKAVAGDEAFRTAAGNAERLAAAAGAPQSESWIAAQQALSVAVAARSPVVQALGDIDALGANRIQTMGGIGPADLKAIQAASARVGEIDDREAALIDRLQARLKG